MSLLPDIHFNEFVTWHTDTHCNVFVMWLTHISMCLSFDISFNIYYSVCILMGVFIFNWHTYHWVTWLLYTLMCFYITDIHLSMCLCDWHTCECLLFARCDGDPAAGAVLRGQGQARQDAARPPTAQAAREGHHWRRTYHGMVSRHDVTACHGMLSQHGVTARCHGMLSRHGVTARCHSMSWHDVTAWCNCTMSQHVVTARCHGTLSRHDVTARCHSMSWHEVTARCHSMSWHDVTACCHCTMSQHVVTARCHGTLSRHGVTAWCHSTLSRHIVMARCHDMVSRHVVMARCHGMVSRHDVICITKVGKEGNYL